NEPTAIEGARPSVSLPPARKPLRSARAGEVSTVEAPPERKGGFLTFLLAILVAAGLLALIGWQALPWLATKPPPEAVAKQEAPKTGPQPASQPPAASAPTTSAEQKPSPVPATAEPKNDLPKTPEQKAETPKQEDAHPAVPQTQAAKPETAMPK